MPPKEIYVKGLQGTKTKKLQKNTKVLEFDYSVTVQSVNLIKSGFTEKCFVHFQCPRDLTYGQVFQKGTNRLNRCYSHAKTNDLTSTVAEKNQTLTFWSRPAGLSPF